MLLKPQTKPTSRPLQKALSLVLLLSLFLGGTGCQSAKGEARLVQAVYPKSVPYVADTKDEALYRKWYEVKEAKMAKREEISPAYDSFAAKTGKVILDPAEENPIYSPLSLYLALGTMGQLTEGQTQAEILEVLGQKSPEDLEKDFRLLFELNYQDDETCQSLVRNSLWFDNSLAYDKDVLNTVGEKYCTDVFSGKMGDEAFDKTLRNYLNEATHNQLKDQIDERCFNPEDIMRLYTSLYFTGRWKDEFDKNQNQEGTFHGIKGDTDATFMTKEKVDGTIYNLNKAWAYAMDLEAYAGRVDFILPQDDATIEEVLKSQDFGLYLRNPEGLSFDRHLVNLYVPKFDIQDDLSLKENLEKLGLNRLFSKDTAEFNFIKDKNQPAWIDQINQSSRISLDEDGIEASNFTELIMNGAAPPPDEIVELKLDRPFILLIRGTSSKAIFMAVVNQVD